MHPKPLAKGLLVETSDSLISTIRDFSGLEVELEQSLKACQLASDLLEQIISSLQVSVQSLSEQSQRVRLGVD